MSAELLKAGSERAKGLISWLRTRQPTASRVGREALTHGVRFSVVDALRGIAAFWVVLFHAHEGGHISSLFEMLPAPVGKVLRHGDLGVAIFFALSGFVISHAFFDTRVTLPFVGKFILRRSVRLDPPYWFAIALALLLATISSRFITGKETLPITTGQVVAHLLYLQECLGYREINPVFWTLCQEVQFYIVYGLLLVLARYDSRSSFEDRRTRIILGGAAVISLLWPLGILSEPWPGSFLPLWNGFIVGAGAYWAWRQPVVAPYYMAYVSILVCAALFHSNSMAFICSMTSVALWVTAVTGNISTGLRWRWLQLLGLVSYSLYLTHNPITGATFRVGYMLTGRSVALEAFWWIVATAVCVLFAWGVWWLIERPSMNLARRVRLNSIVPHSVSTRPNG